MRFVKLKKYWGVDLNRHEIYTFPFIIDSRGRALLLNPHVPSWGECLEFVDAKLFIEKYNVEDNEINFVSSLVDSVNHDYVNINESSDNLAYKLRDPNLLIAKAIILKWRKNEQK